MTYSATQFGANKEVIAEGDGSLLNRTILNQNLAPSGAASGVRVNAGGYVSATVGPDGEVTAVHHGKTNRELAPFV